MHFSHLLIALFAASATSSVLGSPKLSQNVVDANIPDSVSESAAEMLREVAKAIESARHSHQAPSQDNDFVTKGISQSGNTAEKCFWSGAAPFCAGECPSGWRTEKSDDCGDGKCCSTGTKKKCCRTFDLNNCFWSGTAPFCAGACSGIDQFEAGYDNCGDGACCKTGQKAKCCLPL